MSILKNVAMLLIFILLGVALGAGAFYVQQKFVMTPVQEALANQDVEPTATPSPSPGPSSGSTAATYSNASYATTFSLSEGLTVLESRTTDSKGSKSILSLQVLKSKSAGTLEGAGIQAYVISKAALTTSSLETEKASLKKQVLAGLQLTKAAVGSAPASYKDSQGSSVQVYEKDAAESYLLLVQQNSAEASLVSEIIGVTVSPSPSASLNTNATSALYLTPQP